MSTQLTLAGARALAEQRGAEQAWLWPDVTSPSDDLCVVYDAARPKTAAANLVIAARS